MSVKMKFIVQEFKNNTGAVERIATTAARLHFMSSVYYGNVRYEYSTKYTCNCSAWRAESI